MSSPQLKSTLTRRYRRRAMYPRTLHGKILNQYTLMLGLVDRKDALRIALEEVEELYLKTGQPVQLTLKVGLGVANNELI